MKVSHSNTVWLIYSGFMVSLNIVSAVVTCGDNTSRLNLCKNRVFEQIFELPEINPGTAKQASLGLMPIILPLLPGGAPISCG